MAFFIGSPQNDQAKRGGIIAPLPCQAKLDKFVRVGLTVRVSLTRKIVMNAKPQTSEQHTLHCSFCRKSQHDVKKLVAGPAVLICDECVGLCDKIIAETPDPDPSKPVKIKGPEDMPTDQLLNVLAGQDAMYREVRDRTQQTVDILRQREVSWADIAAALNVSRQAAWERFS
jgi:hypothetical protein